MISKLSVFIIVIIAIIGSDATCPDQANNQEVTQRGTVALSTFEPLTSTPSPAPTLVYSLNKIVFLIIDLKTFFSR
jgi:hypothetical protein